MGSHSCLARYSEKQRLRGRTAFGGGWARYSVRWDMLGRQGPAAHPPMMAHQLFQSTPMESEPWPQPRMDRSFARSEPGYFSVSSFRALQSAASRR